MTENYIRENLEKFAYIEPDVKKTDFGARHSFDISGLEKYKNILSSRPIKTELPNFLKKFGTMTFTFLLDFGSFRDLQRHRSGTILMPPLTTKYGFQNWYLEQIPEPYRKEVLDVIKFQTERIHALDADLATKQYYVAMGFNVLCSTTFDLPSAVYVAELRSGQTVHPTLRVIAQQMGKAIKIVFPYIALYCDFDPDTWSSKRGTQTIEKKEP